MKTPQQIKSEVEKGCGKAGKIFKGVKGQYWYADCGKPYLWERDNGKNIPLNKYLCPSCLAKLSILTEYDKSIKEMIENLKLDIDEFDKEEKKRFKKEVFTEEQVYWILWLYEKKIKELLSKIGDNSEVEK